MQTGLWPTTPYQLWLVRISSLAPLLLLGLSSVSPRAAAQKPSGRPSGAGAQQVDGRWLPTGQVIQPAGAVLEFPGRPNDLCYFAEHDLVFVKNHKQLLVVSASDWKIQQSLDSPGGASLTGLAVDQAGRVYFSNANNSVHVFAPQESKSPAADQAQATYELANSIELPAGSFPCGLCLSPDEAKLFVCLSKKNSLAIVDLASQQLEQAIDVGIAPFDVAYVPGSPPRLFVSNLGGRRPRDVHETTATSGGSETLVDERGVANTSSVSIIDLVTMKVSVDVEAGLHPTDVTLIPSSDGRAESSVLVTNSNDDSLTLIQSKSLQKTTQLAKPLPDLPFGSMPNSACVSADGHLLFVGLAGNNAIAVYALDEQTDWRHVGLGQPVGYIPTAWYPVGLACSTTDLYVANLKGLGSRANVREPQQGRNSHDHLGLIQKISLADIRAQQSLAQWSDIVLETSRVLPMARLQDEAQAVLPQPIPDRLGQASTFKHVIYVIKENRTYDQVFGDIDEGRGDAQLCTFPEQFTPNHHALARRFGLLDNYYCNGVLSADGHSWATEANVTPYLERAFGGFTRSYTFGDDPLTYSSSGFLWDHVLAAGLSFRNYGEMDYARPPAGMKYQEIWEAFQNGEAIQFEQNIGIDKLRRYSCRDYPGWNMLIPDVLRVDRFLKEFVRFEAEGTLPNLCIVYLPQDHLGGGVTSAAHMADNDLALGRLVEAVSHSDYWRDTLIIANEDDPQNGFDHIDGHRSICLVISAYSRAGVNHNFYNQTSVIRTILHVFGLPPMNQQDARSPLMQECFVDAPDLRPYQVMPANYPLNQQPSEAAKQSWLERRWRTILASVPIERTGQKSTGDEDNLNRFIWHEMKGWEMPYPSPWAGPHGRGLPALRLQVVPKAD